MLILQDARKHYYAYPPLLCVNNRQEHLNFCYQKLTRDQSMTSYTTVQR